MYGGRRLLTGNSLPSGFSIIPTIESSIWCQNSSVLTIVQLQHHCIDPCSTGTCSAADFCRVMVHRPICGFNERPTPAPREDNFVIGERYNPSPAPVEDNSVVVGERYSPSGEPVRCA